MLARTLSRLLIGAVLVLACATSTTTGGGAAAAAPAIPLISNHVYFDHHWYVWLPRHPTYEAVEIMSIDSPFNPYKLVWVFFTEREGAKRQHHFMDDPLIAEGIEDFYYREIEYRRTGESGTGQSVHVSLTGLDGVPFNVEIDAEGASLSREGAGLTDQSGHGADRVVMLFHRKRSTLAERNRVTIAAKTIPFARGTIQKERNGLSPPTAPEFSSRFFPSVNGRSRRMGRNSVMAWTACRLPSTRVKGAAFSRPTSPATATGYLSSWTPTATWNDIATMWAQAVWSSPWTGPCR